MDRGEGRNSRFSVSLFDFIVSGAGVDAQSVAGGQWDTCRGCD